MPATMLGKHWAYNSESDGCGPAFMALTDRGEGCLHWDLLGIQLPWEDRSEPKAGKDP